MGQTLRPFEAFPAHLVTPRLTTAEAIAERLAFAERSLPLATIARVEHTEEGEHPARRYGVRFHYTDGTSLVIKPHGHAAG